MPTTITLPPHRSWLARGRNGYFTPRTVVVEHTPVIDREPLVTLRVFSSSPASQGPIILIGPQAQVAELLTNLLRAVTQSDPILVDTPPSTE
jgi:hypothetical protein